MARRELLLGSDNWAVEDRRRSDDGEGFGRGAPPRARAAPVTAGEVKAAAAELFAVRGYRATTMRHIASALGIQAPGLYNHVGSKQEILHDIMVGVMTDLLGRAARGPAVHG